MTRAQVLTIYLHELRSALRERNIVVYSIVIPIVMYPAMLWAAFAGLSFVRGQAERFPSRVAVLDVPSEHLELADSLEANEEIESMVWYRGADDALAAIARGDLDALLVFEGPAAGGEALDGNFRVHLHFNEARDRSVNARDRVRGLLDRYRDAWLDRERRGRGVNALAWDAFGIERKDQASAREVTRFLLGLLVPTLMVITIAIATFYPAIDATAGERERSTWETMMTVAAPRSAVATAKYLYVATFGAVGGLLNLTALALSMRWILNPLASERSAQLASTGIPWSALPVIAVGTALLALFVAAGMLVLAAFARTFKEGQSMIMPFYLMLIVPVFFVQDPDAQFSLGMAVIPVINVIMVIRDAILSTYGLPQIALTFASQALFVTLAVTFAQWVLSNEDVYMGTHEGGLGRFLRGRLTRARSQS